MPNDIESTFLCSLAQIKKSIGRLMDQMARENHISRIEAEILLFLYDHPDLNTATQISMHKLLTKSHVSCALKKLEQEGYVRRYYDGHNQKTIYLSLEPRAYDIVHSCSQMREEFFKKMTENIPEEDLARIISLLGSMEQKARDAAENLLKASLR